MRFALMTEPQQGLSYEELLAVAQTAESSGFEALFRSDHYASFLGKARLPTTDAWATIAGLARETSRIRLGSLVSPITFRLPGAFAKLIATIDEMSGGRIEVGMGIGWNELEHRQHGLAFPPVGERFQMLEEQLEMFRGFWSEPHGWSMEGRHWRVDEAAFEPRRRAPGRRSGPYLLLGGGAGPRAAGLAARYADEYNVVSARPETVGEAFRCIREACEAAGRDPGGIVLSAMTGVLVAANDAELRDRVRAQIAMFGDDDDAEAWLEQRRERWVMGTPDRALERIARFEAAGVQRLMLQDVIPRDLDMIRLIGAEILPRG